MFPSETPPFKPAEGSCSSTDLSDMPGLTGACKKSKVCLVCGDKALGCNFNAVSCESCKAFFRRNAHKVIRGRCEGKCLVNVESRSFCKRCRLARCFTVGMRKDMILNDEQKKQRKQKIIINKLRRHGQMSPQDTYAASPKDLLPSTQSAVAKGNAKATGQLARPSKTSPAGNLVDVKKEVVPSSEDPLATPTHRLDSTTARGTPKITRWSDSQSELESAINSLDPEDQRLVHEIRLAVKSTSFLATSSSSLKMMPSTPEEFLNVAELFVRKVIKMAKNVAAFTGLHRQDQISLLKSSVVEIMMLRSAVNYDPFTESWSLNTKECIQDGSHQSSGDRISAHVLMAGSQEARHLFMTYAKFIKSLMRIIHGDLLVLSLLIMISLFSADRAPMVQHSMVERIQETYARILEAYVGLRFQGEKNLFAHMIMKLTDLRNLNEVHSDMLLSMKMQDIEPLLLEVFDIPCPDDAMLPASSPDSSSGSKSQTGQTQAPHPLSSSSSPSSVSLSSSPHAKLLSLSAPSSSPTSSSSTSSAHHYLS